MLLDWSDQELAEELCEIERGLTDWETEFSESILNQTEEGRRLTPRQREVAFKILVRMGRAEE